MAKEDLEHYFHKLSYIYIYSQESWVARVQVHPSFSSIRFSNQLTLLPSQSAAEPAQHAEMLEKWVELPSHYQLWVYLWELLPSWQFMCIVFVVFSSEWQVLQSSMERMEYLKYWILFVQKGAKQTKSHYIPNCHRLVVQLIFHKKLVQGLEMNKKLEFNDGGMFSCFLKFDQHPWYFIAGLVICLFALLGLLHTMLLQSQLCEPCVDGFGCFSTSNHRFPGCGGVFLLVSKGVGAHLFA